MSGNEPAGQPGTLWFAALQPSAPSLFDPSDNERETCSDPHATCTFQRTYGGQLADKAHGIARLADDGAVLVGNSRSNPFGADTAWILRLDRSGNIIWQRRPGRRTGDKVYAVAALDHRIVMAGQMRPVAASKFDVWVFCMDDRGMMVWERSFGGDTEDRARTVAATTDGGFAVGGSTLLPGPAERQAWILKLDSRGRLLWQRTFGQLLDDGVFHIAAMPDRGLIAVGYSQELSDRGYELWALRLDENGSRLWERRLGHGVFDAGTSVAPTWDGGLVVAGVTSADGFKEDDAWVVRLDADGELLWEKRFGGNMPETAWAITETPDHGYWLAVSTSSHGAGSGDAWLIRLNPSGDALWDRHYGGAQWDRPTAATLTSDGGLFLLGYTTSMGAGYEDYWLLRLDASGRF
jgi:hypothetical protein